jgi:CRP/FNR family transcriptional regulator, cyclic AMP receptor protein
MNVMLFHDSEECESVPAGQTLFREGDLGDAFYVVTAGEVDIRVGEELVETVGPGGVVGEMAMIDGGARSASAVARTDSRVVRLDEKRFKFLVQQTPNFAVQVMRIMADRLRRMDSRLESQTTAGSDRAR